MTGEIAVCLKWVAHPSEPNDTRFAGTSPADHSALELALRWADHTGGRVTAITFGPSPAEAVLRDALACGASRALRIDGSTRAVSSDVAAAIASVLGDTSWIWCGDYSLDNGSGSVPAFIAAALDARQALGCVDVSFGGDTVTATRRIDGGRREVLNVHAPAVISVEGAAARLRRASLAAVRTAATAPIEVVTPKVAPRINQHTVHPYRPRARAMAMPAGSNALARVRSLTAATTATPSHHEVETLEPPAAAARIIDALREWGYL